MDSWTDADRSRLAEALRSFDRRGVTAAAERFAAVAESRRANRVLLDQGLEVLHRLHRKRYVDLVQWLAESLLRNGFDHPRIRYRYALALLDDDRLAAAEAVLRRLPNEVLRGDSEVRGAIGRVHKVRYLTGQDESDLGEAVRWYRSTYLRNPFEHHYHGINAAALLVRAADDGVRLEGFARPGAEGEAIAAAILAYLAVLPEPDMWQMASAAEAGLILDRPDEAFRWLTRYVSDSEADAFELHSTLRQLERLHRLVADVEPGRRLLPLLRGRLLRSEGGRLVLSGGAAGDDGLRRLDEVRERLSDPASGLEKRFSNEQFRSIGWLREALVACRAVARIETRLGDGVGTGFLLAGAALGAGLPDRVVLTNAHVVPDVLQPADECYVTFRGNDDAGDRIRHRVRRVLWTSPVADLDATVLELFTVPDDSIPPLRVRSADPAATAGRRAYVIGYPRGVQDVAFSLHDTRVLDLDDRVVHYRSPTEEGSSGSPVFDSEWQVFALHHRGSREMLRLHRRAGTYEANEGIRLDRIRAAIAS